MTLEDINYIAQTLGVVAILGTFVAVLIQYQEGLIDEELWQAHGRQTQAALNDNPVMAEFWALRRDFFMPEYREFRDSQIEGSGGSYTLGYGIKPNAPVADEPKPEPAVEADGAKL